MGIRKLQEKTEDLFTVTLILGEVSEKQTADVVWLVARLAPEGVLVLRDNERKAFHLSVRMHIPTWPPVPDLAIRGEPSLPTGLELCRPSEWLTGCVCCRYMSRPVMSGPGLYDPTTIMNADILAYCQKEGWCKLAFYLLAFFYYLYG